MELHQALYFSRANVPDTPDQMNEILAISQSNNAASGLTGFLHREKNHFVQFLEGPKTPLHETLARIGRDGRHREFQILQHGPAESRFLPDWKMGVFDPDQVRLYEMLDLGTEDLDLTAIDPFDLIVMLVSNAQCMRTRLGAE